VIHDDLRSLLRETKNRYVKRRLDDTWNEDWTIRETKTRRYSKRKLDDTRYRKEFTSKNESTRWYERDDTRWGKPCNTRWYERDDTRRKEQSNTWQRYSRKWAPGASNSATLIYFINLKISPAAPCSVFGRGAWFF